MATALDQLMDMTAKRLSLADLPLAGSIPMATGVSRMYGDLLGTEGQMLQIVGGQWACVPAPAAGGLLETVTSDTSGTGWRRVAKLVGMRGQQTVTVYTIGGAFTPRSTTIRWWHDWGTVAGLTVISEYGTLYWTVARITDDGATAYLEVYFTTDVSYLWISVMNEGGQFSGGPYAGALPAGGDDVRATAKADGLLNIGGDAFEVLSDGSVIFKNRYGQRSSVWSGEAAIFALSKESYPTHGFFYNQASPDMWRFKWAGAQVFGINAEDGAITGGAAGGALKVQTSYGYFQMGPLNASYCHLYTDAPAVIFNKEIQVMGGVIPYTDSAYNFGSPTKQINNIYYDGQLWQGINASILGHIYTINVTTTWAGLPYSAFHPAGGTFILTASRSGYPRRGTIAVVVKEGAAGNHLLSTSFSDGGLNVLASGACEFRSYNGALQFQAATGAYEGNYTIRWIRLN